MYIPINFTPFCPKLTDVTSSSLIIEMLTCALNKQVNNTNIEMIY